jgi:phosphatidylinositol alpha-1,6-mannosyltransferase
LLSETLPATVDPTFTSVISGRHAQCKPRIALLAEAFPPVIGGSGRWFWEAYRRVHSAEVRIVTSNCQGGDEFDAGHDLTVDRINLHMKNSGAFSPSGFAAYWRVARYLAAVHRQTPLSALHCARCVTEGFAGWLFSQMTGVPYLVYVHGEDVSFSPNAANTGVMSSRQHRWMARRVLGGARLLLANSENTRHILESTWHVPSSRIRVVNPGVDADRFVPADPCDRTRQEFGWTNREVILTVGRLQKRKGHDHLLKSLPGLRKSHPQVLYAIVGDGEELGTLRQLAADLGVTDLVQFHTQTSDDDLIRMYQQCDLFVLPNRAVGNDIEGFGMVLVEAQACGKPVIAGNSGGTRETMLVPETGRIVHCEGGPELEEVIRQLLGNPSERDRMGKAAIQWVAGRFAWEAVVTRMERVFDEVRGPSITS